MPPPVSLERPGPIVEVEWSDIETTYGWRDEAELEKAKTDPLRNAISVGYLVADLDDRIVIIQSSSLDSHSERTVIPRAVVSKVTRISPRKKR